MRGINLACGGGRVMAPSARPVVLLAVMAVLAGCGPSGFNKAGDSQQRRPVVLTLANANGNTGELDGFANNVRRLSGGTMEIAIKYNWRPGQVKPETGMISDVRAGKRIWASSAAGPGTPSASPASRRSARRC
jgi:hypothetical protein